MIASSTFSTKTSKQENNFLNDYIMNIVKTICGHSLPEIHSSFTLWKNGILFASFDRKKAYDTECLSVTTKSHFLFSMKLYIYRQLWKLFLNRLRATKQAI